MKSFRLAGLAAAFLSTAALAAPGLVGVNGLSNTSPPSGYAAQPVLNYCANTGSPGSGNCEPAVVLYDPVSGLISSFNADTGLNVHITGGGFPVDTTISGTGTISAADVGSTVTANQQNGQTLITGSPTANSTISFSGVAGFQTGTLQCTGTFSQTDQVQVSTDGVVWSFAKWASFGNGPNALPPFTLPFSAWNINLAGAHYVRIDALAWVSGSPTCTLAVTANLLTASNAVANLRGSNNTTGTGATTIIAAQGASTKINVKGVQCKNSGATSTIVTLNDSVNTVLIVPAAAGDNEVFDPPLSVAANTALTFTPGAGSTTIYCNAQGYTGS